jgi:subtilisin-like proprotein convertase family protein
MATESSSSTSTGVSTETHDATDPHDHGTTLGSSSTITTTDVSADSTTADLTTTGSTGPTLDTADTEEPPQQIEYCAVANLPIPDEDVNGVSSSIEVDLLGGGTIVSLQLVIEATHPFVGDLRFDLRKMGATIIVLDRPGGGSCSGNDIDVVLHDGGTAPADASCIDDDVGPALSGELQPHTAFDPVFAGAQMLGTWRLLASDRAEDDTGTLDSWCLRITYR